MTLAEFLEWDDGSDRRYELLDGVPMMMPPSLEAHGELAATLTVEIGNRLRPPCRALSEAGIVIPNRADTYYVADLAVTCAPRELGPRMVVEPVVTVEMRSPARDEINQWRKVADYRTLPSVREILVVFSDERRVEIQRRTPDGWRVDDLIGKAEVNLCCCNGPISLGAIYRDLLPDNALATQRSPKLSHD